VAISLSCVSNIGMTEKASSGGLMQEAPMTVDHVSEYLRVIRLGRKRKGQHQWFLQIRISSSDRKMIHLFLPHPTFHLTVEEVVRMNRCQAVDLLQSGVLSGVLSVDFNKISQQPATSGLANIPPSCGVAPPSSFS
jgi:hypothetical protein